MPQRYICRIAINRVRNVILMVLLFALLIPSAPAHAAPPAAQDDPAAQCAEGVRLARDGETDAALPLLEAGFAGRDRTEFSNLEDLGYCAFRLGYLRYEKRDLKGALLAYDVALTTFRQSGNRTGEGTTLNNIGGIYRAERRYVEALEMYQQALVIQREIGNRAAEGRTLNSIGNAYEAQGHYLEALEAYYQALTIRREIRDRAGEGRTLNNISKVYEIQGRYIDSLKILYQALAIAHEDGDQFIESGTLRRIGTVYKEQGRYAEALEKYYQALAIQRKVGDRRGEGATLNSISEIHRIQGRYTEALNGYHQSLIIKREVGDIAGEVSSLNNIGIVYRLQGNYSEALKFYQQALTIQYRVGRFVDLGHILNNIGFAYHHQGRYPEALQYYQQALDIWHEIGDLDGESLTLTNIGDIYRAQGYYAKALQFLQRALVLSRNIGDRDGEGGTLNNIGIVYEAQGRYAEALETFYQALLIRREMGNRNGEGSILNNIGIVYEKQGYYNKAYDSYQQALVIRQELGDRGGEQKTLIGIGNIYTAQGRYTQALEVFQQSLAIVKENNTSKTDSEGVVLTNIGEVYHAQGQYADALKIYQQATLIYQEVGSRALEGINFFKIGQTYSAQRKYNDAVDAYLQALDALEDVRAQAGDDQGRTSFIAQHAHVYERAALLYHQQGNTEQAFFTVERGRARAFLDSLATGTVELADDAANDLLQREREAHARRQTAQDALIRARALTDPDAELVADLEAQLAEAEQAYSAVQAEIAGRGDQLAELVSARKDTIPSLRDLQEDLPADTTLVSYLVGEDSSLAFVVTNSSLRAVELPVGREQLTTQMIALHSFDGDTKTTTTRLTAFYEQLIAPLALDPYAARLLIIPHGVLHYLPFAALAPAGGPLLGDQFTIALLPTAGVLPFIQRPLPAATPLPQVVAFANPNNGEIAGVEEAAATIGTLFATDPIVGAGATVPALRAAAPQAHILHLGAHGSFSPTVPLDSHIQLTPTGADDGRLTVSQVYGLDLGQTALVVLSACETQVNQLNIDSPLAVTAGDELVGLQRAFLYAGAQNVVTTLWQVPDAASARLMERFYTHLRLGRAPADALQQAQQDIRAEYPNPRDWAGFVLTGLGTMPLVTLPWWQQVPWWAWTLGAGGLLLLAGGLWWRRGRKEGME